MSMSIDRLSQSYQSTRLDSGVNKEITTKEAGVNSIKEKNIDKVSIQSSDREVKEKLLSEDITKAVIKETDRITSQNKIDDLQKRISQGNYQIDMDQLASKILGVFSE